MKLKKYLLTIQIKYNKEILNSNIIAKISLFIKKKLEKLYKIFKIYREYISK